VHLQKLSTGKQSLPNQLVQYNTNRPIMIDNKPMKRSWPSLNDISRENVSRHVLGNNSGIAPSSINIKANAGRR